MFQRDQELFGASEYVTFITKLLKIKKVRIKTVVTSSENGSCRRPPKTIKA